MKLSEIKSRLPQLSHLTFLLPNGTPVPAHFHITEVGQVNKRFIDCGGTLRDEKTVNFQLWEDGDYDHRLGAKKLLDIIQLSERVLGLEDLEVEVEYQGDTIGKYGLEFNGGVFTLTNKMTDCLAKDKCGIPAQKPKVRLSILSASESSCAPGSGCC
ncbi:hypothetical protein SAMN03080617_03402 [Algoriphagus alkaliphilus]|uniref:Uncharacterized protein n=1 Tax=Algoriphagus alkaliphilus TaxID=279824 RepID=A0A1G5Z9Q3_9BACT|nr:DUF6428 family protein [Algoriphagus alkaliphilus]MBA4301984.1 hypothetical protein [Cyclobacterium sp.]SDA91352.1 hypothetical protein SAMN03080617_03402 [Algoriphagus alkaliphilus]